jgi:peptidoglycan pentaglycine glycine transferase (the first glycine)
MPFPTRPAGAYHARTSPAEEDPAWNRFLTTTPGGHYVQSSHWAQLKTLSGWHPARFVVTQDGQIVAGAQLMLHRLPR